MRYILLFGCFILAVVSCKNKTENAPDVGYDYAPERLGKYVVYDVDSTIYDDFNMDTVYYKYRIKELLEDEYVDNEGRHGIRLVRFIKKYNDTVSYDNIAWEIKDVWNYTKTSTALQIVEEDIRFTKLVFPVREEITWNGNANNSIGDWQYNYTSTDRAETINGTAFDNVLTVTQKDDKGNNKIHRQYYVEKYAKDVGMVYREIKDLQSYTVTAAPVENRISKGVIYKLNYVTHGYE
ncbi:MAG: hypothetical protein V4677_18065 [Bacteroidota bacterium]